MSNIDEVFKTIPRSNFLPQAATSQADIDMPLPIGYGQTNSQPSTVRLMLNWLDPQAGDKILDVGSGSGWTTAMLAYMVGALGTVYAVEKVPELVRFGEANCWRMDIDNVLFFQSEDTYGLPGFAPYDRILVSAAVPELPQELVNQLKDGGRMVIPIKHSIHVIDKVDKYTIKNREYAGFVFVPLV